MLSNLKPLWRNLILAILILGAGVNLITSKAQYQSLAKTDFILLSSQMKAVDTAYQLANGREFASYQYLPEVYDYSYQEIYDFTADTKHRALPTEVSYSPGESAYNPWMKRSSRPSDLQVLIVEADTRPQFFPAWWEKMTTGREIFTTQKVTDKITVYLTRQSVSSPR